MTDSSPSQFLDLINLTTNIDYKNINAGYMAEDQLIKLIKASDDNQIKFTTELLSLMQQDEKYIKQCIDGLHMERVTRYLNTDNYNKVKAIIEQWKETHKEINENDEDSD